MSNAKAPDDVPPGRPMLAWIAYDVGASTYAAVVPSVLFALHFTADIAAGLPSAAALWGVLSASAMVAAGLLAPIVGAVADGRRAHARLLAAFTLLCCAATALLPIPAKGQILFASLVFLLAQVGYTVAIALYDAYLERLGPLAGGTERLSTRGWALGFIGGTAAVLAMLALPRNAQEAPLPELAFPVVALMFAAIAVPAVAGLARVSPLLPGERAERHPWRRVARTLAHWREQRPILRFLLASYLINDAMVTVIVFIAIYLRDQFALDVRDLLLLTLLYHAIALPATWLFGSLAERTTPRLAVTATLAIWVVTILVLALGQGRTAAVAVVVLLASVLGSTQALLRGMYARIVPPGRVAEFFGFNALVGRLSAALGPLTFAAVAAATGSQRLAFLSLVLFFVAGGALLWRLSAARVPATT